MPQIKKVDKTCLAAEITIVIIILKITTKIYSLHLVKKHVVLCKQIKSNEEAIFDQRYQIFTYHNNLQPTQEPNQRCSQATQYRQLTEVDQGCLTYSLMHMQNSCRMDSKKKI